MVILWFRSVVYHNSPLAYNEYLPSSFASSTNTRLSHQRRACLVIHPICPLISVYRTSSYIGAEFPKVLEMPEVEYRQANLTVECKSLLHY